MELLRYIVLGIIQGLTEPLPISSSGHLMIARNFMSMPAIDYFLEVWLHFASLLAILWLLRKRIKTLIIGLYQYIVKRNTEYKHEFVYALCILIGVVPAGIIGLFFKTWIEVYIIGAGLIAIGISLYVTALMLFVVEKQSITNDKTVITWKDALFIGLFQVFALLPGISRSGSTLVGGLLKKLDFKTLIEFSFMLYIPISVASMGLELLQITTLNHPINGLIVSFILSAFLTYFALRTFIQLVEKGYLKYFAWYCLLAGTIAIITHIL